MIFDQDLLSRTQPSGPLCLWQCYQLCNQLLNQDPSTEMCWRAKSYDVEFINDCVLVNTKMYIKSHKCSWEVKGLWLPRTKCCSSWSRPTLGSLQSLLIIGSSVSQQLHHHHCYYHYDCNWSDKYSHHQLICLSKRLSSTL